MEEPEELTFQYLLEITDGFAEERKIGEGAFAVVYKGVTPHGEDVAVKKLKLYGADAKRQFRNEFYNLTKLKHHNIVQCLGYCYEIEKKPFIMPDGSRVLVEKSYGVLCFEYLHNGSLRNHLSDEFCGLDWHTRFKIIKGTCEGLRYIHKELEEPLYHLDLKPDNILLDKNMVPKIADFCLSEIFDKEELTRTMQDLYGTCGYQPPEYIDRGEISGKFDIFSLGVIIIRIVSGRNGFPKCLEISSDDFIHQVGKNWRNMLQETCSSDSLLEAYCNQVETCTQIALSCVEINSQKRPDILKIIDMLNKVETAIDKKQGHKTVSEVIMHKQKTQMRTESKDITGQHQSIDLITVPHCNELEIDDSGETPSHVGEELIVGRTEEKEKIMAYLLDSMSTNVVILPIYGIGGIGKTTFAKLIYNDPKYKCYSHVWVNVSQRFDLNKICESIILQLSGKESQINESQMIHSCLAKLLSGKRVLIVLDDLWEDNQFQLQDLKEMLYHDDSNVTILVTTRSARVAERISTNTKPYKILPLTDEMCWDIIKQRSDFDARHDKEHLTDIGMKIAQKCGGVALAAVSLGFTLLSKNFDQWMGVKNSNIWNEPVSKDVNDVLASLKLSYNCMDTCLQQCFIYCAVFPKGHKIAKEDLVYQWILLGIIKPTKLLSSMQLCENYIVHLLRLSFFEHAVTPEASGVAHYHALPCFTMPDLVHDMASSVIRDANPRYALLTDCSKPLEMSCTSAARLWALRFWDCWRIELRGCAFASAESLRVLDLSECFIQKLPDSIGNLKQLKYLNAPQIQDRMIPRSLMRLQNLIYLNLHGSYLVSALPESIGEMDGLEYLNLSDCSGIERLPESLGNLKTLVQLNLANCCRISALPDSIGEMHSLMHLNLSDCSGIERLPKSLGMLQRLVHLNLANCSSVKGVSESLGSLTELQYLNLSHCTNIHLSDDVQLHQWGLYEVVGFLSNLRYLNLSGCFTGLNETSRLIDCIRCLYNLEHLDLSDNRGLTTLPESIANLRKMHTLDLSGCINLSELPPALRELYNLNFLILENCISLRFSGLPQLSNVKAVPPKFVVKARDGLSSNLVLLLDANNVDVLNISGLENVKATEEALKVKLMGKRRITELEFNWTRDAKRSVKDRKVLEYLVPPKTLIKLKLGGYNSETFPYWLMAIVHYLPYITAINMEDLANCDTLPPLGQLRNLAELVIRGMDSITDIDESFYGGPRAFPQLKKFELSRMGSLQVWKTKYSFEDGLEELMSPNLEHLTINDCPMLRLIPCPPRPSAVNWKIYKSDNVLSSWAEGAQICTTSSTTVLDMSVKSCEVPLHQWRLLHHIPALTTLRMEGCSDLRIISPEIIKRLSAIQSLSLQDQDNDQPALPEWLGELATLRNLLICGYPEIEAPLGIMKKLTSLKSLSLSGCERMTVLPHWLVELTSLQSLEISDCPKLDNLHVSMGHLLSLHTLALRNCRSISVLPDWLGDLVALKEFVIQNCVGIKFFPKGIERLTKLEELKIIDCPDLKHWCQIDEKMFKLISHIKTKKGYHSSRNQSMDCKIQNTTSEPKTNLMTRAQLEEITNGFSEDQIIGRGGHGEVYWGLTNGKRIAVKLLRVNMQELLDDQLFRNELRNLIMLKHPNIVQLVGYCYETHQKFIQWNGIEIFPEMRYRALCLEYLHNGSLRNHLCDEFGGPDWYTRYNIIKGTCEGLNYLHNGNSKPIYHLDLKPDNILLDENMVPKLADFGMSKMLGVEHTWTTQNCAGTVGYMPPEYIKFKKVSDKMDIYSLGFVMIDIIAGPEWRAKLLERSLGEFIDDVNVNWRNRLRATCHGRLLETYCKQIKRCTQLSLKCIEDDRDRRPSIVDIINELD